MSGDKGCNFLEITGPWSCKYSVDAACVDAQWHGFTCINFRPIRWENSSMPLRSANKIVGIGLKEWNKHHTGKASHHKTASHNIDGTKLVKAHLDSSPMNINISVRLIFPALIHGTNRIYSYPIQNSEVEHYLWICTIINFRDDEHMVNWAWCENRVSWPNIF